MGTQLNEKVEQAVKILWGKVDPEKGAEAKKWLEEAVEEGDGDACFYLARCYFGKCFINPAFGFEENDPKGEAILEKGLERGSAIAMFGARRVGGFKPARNTFVYPPYNSDKEIWDAVEQKAETGSAFCKLMLANAYYFGDVIEMKGIPENEIDANMVQGFMLEAAYLYEQCLDKGLAFGANNLVQIFKKGEYGIPQDMEKVHEIEQKAADLNIADFETAVGIRYLDTDVNKAEEYLLRGAKHGDSYAYLKLLRFYSYGGHGTQDLRKAMSYGKKGLEMDPDQVGFCNYLGEIYYYGGDGMEPDYARAVEHFERVISENNWSAGMLGTCYLKGLGTAKDVKKAYEMFQKRDEDELCDIGLGEIYCYGLNGEQNIKAGMQYLNKYPNNERAQEIKSHFKKTLFGWKQITE